MSDAPPLLDALPPPPNRGMAKGAFIAAAQAFVLALVTFGAQINVVVTWLWNVGATITRPRNGTSITEVTLAVADLTFVTQPNLGILKGYKAALISNASPANQARGVVKSYNSVTGETVLTATDLDGAGTFSDWIFAQIPYTKKATAAQVRAMASDDTYVSPKGLADSAAFAALAYGATINWDITADGYNAKVTLAGGGTITPSHIKPGIGCNLAVKQDATGSRVPSWASGLFDWGNNAIPTFSTGANKEDLVSFIGNPAGDKLLYVGFTKSA